MITVNFTVNTGETTYLYSFAQCVGDKNVTFKLADASATWCRITPGTNSIKISVDAVPLTQESSRSARINIYLNDPSQTTPCAEYFQVTQPGRVQCDCTTFAPILIGATFAPSGASVGTVIGTYTNGTCPVGTISIVGTNGLQAEATNGQIKLTRAISAYEDGRDFDVSFKFTDALGTTTECATGTCSQTKVPCDCEHVGQIITMSDRTLPLDERDMILIATADKLCGVFSAECNSPMLDTVIGGETYASRVRVDDDGTTLRAYVHVKQATAYRSCAVTPLLKFKGSTEYVPCSNGAITIIQTNDYVRCSTVSGRCPDASDSTGSCIRYGAQYTSLRCDGGTLGPSYRIFIGSYSVSDVIAVPRIEYMAEMTEGDWTLSYGQYETCWRKGSSDGTAYTGDVSDWVNIVPQSYQPHPGAVLNNFIAYENNSNYGRYIRMAYDIYTYGEFCATSSCKSHFLVLPCGCTDCANTYRQEKYDDNYTEEYESKTIEYDWDEIQSIMRSFACYTNMKLVGVYADARDSEYSSYVHITDLRGDSTNGYTHFTLVVDENDTGTDFRYYLTLSFALQDGTTCSLTVRNRIKKHNECSAPCEVLRDYTDLSKNLRIGDWQSQSSDCNSPKWVNYNKPIQGTISSSLPCDSTYDYKLYLVLMDGNNNEIGGGEFINQNGNRMKVDTNYGYVYTPGKGWHNDACPTCNYAMFIFGYYPGVPGTTVDLDFLYKYRLIDENSGNSCESDDYKATGSYTIYCEGETCNTPSCSSNFVTPYVTMESGVPTIDRGGKTKVLFPATGATITAYTVTPDEGYRANEWCTGYSVSYSVSTTHTSNIHPSLVQISNRTKIVIQVDSTSNADGIDYTIDLHVYINYEGDLTECSNLNKTIELYQRGVNEN